VEQTVEKKSKRTKSFTGQVVSDKMDKTIVVAVVTKTLDPLYKKYLKRTKKVKAHDENNEARMGDTVRVIETKPISKEKFWTLEQIVERAR
jgi:small subunit ribosomal protein S17